MDARPARPGPRRSEVPLEALTPPWWLAGDWAVSGSGPPAKTSGPETSSPTKRGAFDQEPRSQSGPPSAGAAGAAVTANALIQRLRQAIRQRHYSHRTEKSYAGWVQRFVAFHRYRDPALLGTAEVRAYLTHLAVRQQVSASTQNQAFSALLFLFREVLERKVEGLDDTPRAKSSVRLPVVLSRHEVRALLGRLRGRLWLIASLMYGSGLRLQECLALRIKDVDFGRRVLVVRDGKGRKDRETVFPENSWTPSESSSSGSAAGTTGTWLMAAAPSPSRTPSSGNTLGRRGNWAGIGSSRRLGSTSIPAPVSSDVTTCTRQSCSGYFGARSGLPA
jgi:hypothetical protein